MKSVKEILETARARISKRRDWCVGDVHHTASDGHIQRCARGAIMEAINPKNIYAASQLREVAAAKALLVGMIGAEKAKGLKYPVGALCDWNNSHSHKAVVNAFDKAIKAL